MLCSSCSLIFLAQLSEETEGEASPATGFLDVVPQAVPTAAPNVMINISSVSRTNPAGPERCLQEFSRATQPQSFARPFDKKSGANACLWQRIIGHSTCSADSHLLLPWLRLLSPRRQPSMSAARFVSRFEIPTVEVSWLPWTS